MKLTIGCWEGSRCGAGAAHPKLGSESVAFWTGRPPRCADGFARSSRGPILIYDSHDGVANAPAHVTDLVQSHMTHRFGVGGIGPRNVRRPAEQDVTLPGDDRRVTANDVTGGEGMSPPSPRAE
jgi:hypothetical protein